MVSADQKPLVAHEASPPSTTAIAPVIGRVAEHVAVIVDRLRPARGRRILGADAAAHRQGRARRPDWDS